MLRYFSLYSKDMEKLQSDKSQKTTLQKISSVVWKVTKTCGKIIWDTVKIGIAVACSLFDNESGVIAQRLIAETFKSKNKQNYEQAWDDGVTAAITTAAIKEEEQKETQ